MPTSCESCLTGIDGGFAVFFLRHGVHTRNTHGTGNFRGIFHPLPGALYSITVGRMMAFATPCGVS